MEKHTRLKRIVKGEDAKYMARAMDRQGIPYQKAENGDIELLMTDDEYTEALEDAQCEREMEAIDYHLCIVSLRTSCSTSGKLGKILRSMNARGYTIMEKDKAAFNEMLKYDI